MEDDFRLVVDFSKKKNFIRLYVCGRYRQGATTELRLTKKLGLALVRGLV